MLKMDIGYLVKNMVRGIHGDKNSPEASGAVLDVPTYFHEQPTKSLLFGFDVRAHKYYPNGEEISSCRMIHLLFHRFHGSKGFCSTYTFGATTDIFEEIHKASEIKFLSSHDSCWDDAAESYIRNVEYDIRAEMIRQDPELDTHDINWNIFFPFSLDPFKWVDTKFFRVPSDGFRSEVGVKIL